MPESEKRDVGWLQNHILELHAQCEEAARAGRLEQGSDALLQLRGIVDTLSVVKEGNKSFTMLHGLAAHAEQKAMKQMEDNT